MPEENGIALVVKVGEMPQKMRPKVVICSAYVTPEMAEDFKHKGLFVLRKPFRLEELENVLTGLA
jgi:CheY-like chemotaxis protein